MAGDWNSAAHPRAPKGPGGGEFAGGSSGSSPRKASAKAPARRTTVPKGSLGFDGHSGTGYGSRNGDARVKALQKRLNALGIKDANGKPLALDGKLGPKTTAAIKAWQRKNGMKPTGMVDAASLKKLSAHRSKTAHIRRAKPKPSLVAGMAGR